MKCEKSFTPRIGCALDRYSRARIERGHNAFTIRLDFVQLYFAFFTSLSARVCTQTLHHSPTIDTMPPGKGLKIYFSRHKVLNFALFDRD